MGEKLYSREEVIQAIQSGKRLDGANLRGIDLSNSDLKEAWFIGANLQEANLERANLEHAHLYGANLKGANLFNANLEGANLKAAHLEGSNILEVKLSRAKISGIFWGKEHQVLAEEEAREIEKRGSRQEAITKYREAEEIYRNLRIHLNAQGAFGEAGNFFYREMVVRRKQLSFWTLSRLGSKIIDLLCGYGEKTFRVVSSALMLIFFCSFFYFFEGIRFKENVLRFSQEQTFFENAKEFALSLYFSVVTFTTLGYGDIAPFGFSRVIAATEAFLGAFMIALFVLVFARKMLR